MKKLFLLDAYALIFRAYYAFIKNPRYSTKGLNTSAIYGFVNTLEEILKNEKPTHIGIAFDTKDTTFRKEIFPDYKANRDATPEDILKAVPYIKQILHAHKIPIIETPGFEADDAIGTLAKKASKQGFEVYMMTPDKDYLQLLEENVHIFKPRSRGKDNEIINLATLYEKYKINKPEQFIDILALWGDTSDNIPGVTGIGEKTAAKLIKRFGSIEGIYKNMSKLKGKQKENLQNEKEKLMLSQKLVTIKTDMELEFNEAEFEKSEPDWEKLKEIYTELEFRTLIARLNKKIGADSDENLEIGQSLHTPEAKKTLKTYQDFQVNYQLVQTESEIEALLEKLKNEQTICFDTETTNLKPQLAEIVGLAISIKENEAFYLPFPENQAETQKIIDKFLPIFADTNKTFVGQNIKYDLLILKNYGIEVAGKLFDTMIAHYLLYPEQKHNMDFLAESYLSYKTISIEELIGKKGKNQGSMRDVAPEKIVNYACEDADITLQLKNIFEKELFIQQLTSLFSEIEMPLIKVLADMEHTGVKIDSDFLKNYKTEIAERAKNAEEKIYKLAGTEFNIGSPKQLGEILFDKLDIKPKPKLTKTKQYSTSETELLKVKDKHEIIPLIFEYRSLIKLINTYIDALPQLINPKTDKIHTSYNQAVASTGRLSSNDPNLQNIPIRTPEGRKIREAFVPSSADHILIDADYSQIELRLMAHLSGDKNMIDAFVSGEDIHRATAAKIYGVDKSKVTSEMRYNAKSANFAIIYGSSAFGLSQNLNISTKEAKQLIDGYFNTYPKVKEYMDNCIKQARETEKVFTLKGRKRYLRNINSRNGLLRSNAERNAINAPIQGSAADIIKLAMINISEKLKTQGLKSKMIMQVHDELTFDALKSEKEQLKKIIKQEMENAVSLSIPLDVDMNEGENWNESH